MSFCVLDDFFRFSKNLGFWVFLVHPTVVSVLLSASVERCFVSRMRDFHRIGPLGRFDLVVAMSIYLSIYLFICPLSMRVFSRPLIGPYIRGLSSLALALPSALPSAHYHLRTTICALPSAHYHLRTTICFSTR